MKQLKFFLLVTALVLSIVGCRKTIDVSFENATQELDPQGGSIALALKSNGEWTISSSEDWIAIEPMSGNGDAMLTLTAQANTTGESRSAIITATTKDNTASTTVTQNALEYYLSVTPHEILCGADGGAFTVSVSSNVEWNVILPQWITSSVTEGSNDAMVTLIVNPLEGEAEESRMFDVIFGNPFGSSETINVSDKVHVVQTVEPVLGIEVSPSALSYANTGETKTVAVTTEDGWTATVEEDWVTLSQTEGLGDAEISVSVDENPAFVTRRTLVHFETTGGVQTDLVIRQDAALDPHFLEVSPLEFEFGKEGGEREISISCDTSWVLVLECEWLSLSQLSGTGDATVVLTSEPNELNAPRSTMFGIKSGVLSYEFTVNQEAGDIPIELSFESDTVFVNYTGGIQHVELNSNVSWQLQTSNWIMATTTSGVGDASFDIIVDNNSASDERIGFVRAINGGEVRAVLIVVQEGKPNILEADATYIDVRPEGGDFVVHVTANQSWAVKVNMDWMQCNPLSGVNNGSFTISVDPLPSTEPRVGQIKIVGSLGAVVMITVDQH